MRVLCAVSNCATLHAADRHGASDSTEQRKVETALEAATFTGAKICNAANFAWLLVSDAEVLKCTIHIATFVLKLSYSLVF